MTAQPEYIGLLPWMAQWWLDHLDTPPLVVIRCGKGEPRCPNAIGEIKRDEDRLMAMSRNEHPEVETDWQPLAAPTAAELADDIADRDAEVLRYVGTGPGAGRIVYKRTVLPREVAPIEDLGYYTCRVHGEVEVDCEHLAAFARDTPTPKRTYWASGVTDLK